LPWLGLPLVSWQANAGQITTAKTDTLTMMVVMLLLNSVVGGAVMVVGGATVAIVQITTWLFLLHAEIKKGKYVFNGCKWDFNILNG
jgi:hypothetical protein